jgi:hypothetical protein
MEGSSTVGPRPPSSALQQRGTRPMTGKLGRTRARDAGVTAAKSRGRGRDDGKLSSPGAIQATALE